MNISAISRGGFFAPVLSVRRAPETSAIDGPIGDRVFESNRSSEQRSDRDSHETRDVVRSSATQPAASAARDEAGVAPGRLSSLRDAGVKLAVEERNAANLLARLTLVVRLVSHAGRSFRCHGYERGGQ